MLLALGGRPTLSVSPSSGTQWDTSADHGSSSTFTVTASFAAFQNGDRIEIGSHWYDTTFVSGTQLTCSLPDAGFYKSPWNESGSLAVQVRRGGSSGSVIASGATLTVTAKSYLTDYTLHTAFDIAHVQQTGGFLTEWTDQSGNARDLVKGSHDGPAWIAAGSEGITGPPSSYNDREHINFSQSPNRQGLVPDAAYSLAQPYMVIWFLSVPFSSSGGRLQDSTTTLNQATINVNFGGDTGLLAMFTGGSVSSGTHDLAEDRWAVCTWYFNAGSSFSKIEGFARRSETNVTNVTVSSGLQIGDLDSWGSNVFASRYRLMERAVLTSFPANDTAIERIEREIRWRNSQPWFVSAFGDSLTDPSHNSLTHWFEQLGTDLGSTYGRLANFAISGATLDDMINATGAQQQEARWADFINLRQVLVVFIFAGTNDIQTDAVDAATVQSRMAAVVSAVRTKDSSTVKTIIVTFSILSRGFVTDAATKEATRVAVNSAWAASPPGDIHVDMSADTNIGTPTAYQNTTYFSDGTHLTQTGQDYLYSTYAHAVALQAIDLAG